MAERRDDETAEAPMQAPSIRPATVACEAGEPPPTDAALVAHAHRVEWLLRASNHFGGDLESFLLWGVLARPTATRSGLPSAAPVPMRLRDLARISGIPRETARRKLGALERAGRIQRVTDGWMIDVAAIDAQSLALMLDCIERVDASGMPPAQPCNGTGPDDATPFMLVAHGRGDAAHA
jgi:hypothetical protein